MHCVCIGPSDDKGLADSPLKRPNRVSRGMRPWSIHVNETDELMKKLEKRKKLEQSHAQSQEMDNSTPLHLSQQPLTGVCVCVCVCGWVWVHVLGSGSS